jgi:hypothetical protein
MKARLGVNSTNTGTTFGIAIPFTTPPRRKNNLLDVTASIPVVSTGLPLPSIEEVKQ